MNPRSLMIVSCLGVVALAGCRPGDFMRGALEAVAPDDDEAMAIQCLSDLRLRDFDAVSGRLDRSLLTGNLESNLAVMADLLAHGEPLSVELVGCNVISSAGKRRSSLTYQFQFAQAWVLGAVTIDTSGAAKQVMGIQVNPLPNSLGELNAFTLSGRSVTHYVILALAIALPALIVVALITCIRTPGVKRKWLWIVFILFGVGSVGLNWTTGQVLFNPLSVSIHLFAVSIFKQGPYAPWIITVSLPLGAIIFLLGRKKLAAQVPPPMPPTANVTSAGQLQ